MGLFLNAFISTTRLDGTPVYTGVEVQLDDQEVEKDPGFVEIRTDASTALAPLVHKVIYDEPGGVYQKGDLVTILQLEGEETVSPVPYNPFHVVNVQYPGNPLPATEVAISRLNVRLQTALRFPVITAETPGAVPAASFNTNRSQILGDSGADCGRGYQAMQNNVLRQGYLAGVLITIAINEYSSTTHQERAGVTPYESPVVIYEPPLVLHKYDLLVLGDGRRLVIADTLHLVQRYAVTLGTFVRAEIRKSDDVVYGVS